jgi:ribosomal protein S8
MNLPAAKREKAIVAEILQGNIPNFQRFLYPVERRLKSGPFRGQILRFWVVPDYLAIGSDRDYVRVPLNMYSVKALAQKLDLSLPTAKMVDDIYVQAKVKLKPVPLPVSKAITSTGLIMKHHGLVQNQLKGSNWRPGLLVAGHKKDVVQSRRLTKKPKAIAIYGWHQKNATPIQPLSTVHNADYADYSHGIRLVSNAVEIGNRTMDLRDVLSQKPTAALLSNEGVIPQPHHISGGSTFPMASH